MPGWWLFLLVVVTFGAVLWAARRATTLFEVTAHEGKIVRAKGRIPAPMFDDLEEVFARSRTSGRLWARLEGGELALTTTIEEPLAQQLRNVVFRFPLARIRAAKRR